MIEKIKQSTVVEQVMARIKDLIASGQYKVGDRLPTESELAERFGIGRSSLREAIKIFNYLGILESHASKGTFVCDRSHISTEALSWAALLGGDELFELIEMRAAIELWSILQLTDRFAEDASQFTPYMIKLDEIIEQMRQAVASKDINLTNTLDFQFHDLTISSSDNSIFISIYHTLRAFMMKTINDIHQDEEISNLLPDVHQRLVVAIKSHDKSKVMLEMQDHIRITREKLNALMLKNNPVHS